MTAEGFVGKGMDDLFKTIYATSNGNLDKAHRSIVLFDEVDKIASRGDPIKDLDVQQGLLKVLEGAEFSFENKRGSGQIKMDTSFMTKVGSGAFMDLFDKRKQKRTPGFNSVEEKIEEKVLKDTDIINYGFLPEFVGRFPLIYTYKPLDDEGLKLLLTQSKISPLLQIKERFEEEFGLTIEYDDDFLFEIIDAALKTEAGGRSLKKIIDSSFIKLEGALIDEQDLEHEIPKTLRLKKEMVQDPSNFNL
jgi:ATP-dependent Clp protease ATP-binding subunit ClpX